MKYLALFILSLIFWMLLTFRFTVSNLLVGAILSGICSIVYTRYYFTSVKKFLEPRRYFWFLIYLFFFIWECIKANFDVAYRVLHPAMPIRPGIVKVKTTLKSKFAIMLLANSITMTPGTITVDVIDDELYIHWIFVRSTDPKEYTNMITGKFERFIKNIVE